MFVVPCFSGNVKGADNLAGSSYDAYVDYLTEVVAFYRDEANITFSTIEPFNEPSSTAWFQGNNQEGCHYDVTTQRAVLQAGSTSLNADSCMLACTSPLCAIIVQLQKCLQSINAPI